MKLLLMADNDVGEIITRWLLANYRDDIALVVTTEANAIADQARAANVETIVFESDAQVARHLAQAGTTIDLGLLAWWPKLIREPLLNIATHGLVNTHPSLLPYNRGKHYNFWALIEQAPFGVTLHFVADGIDSGDIVAQREIAYGWEDTGETLFMKARESMVSLLQETYPLMRTLQIPRRTQDASAGSLHFARELDAASVFDIDQSYNARQLLNLLRARTFAGHPAAWFSDDNSEYEVRVDIRKRAR